MPSLHIFKNRRKKLDLTLREVSEATKMSKSMIYRIEKEDGGCGYQNIVKLHDFYVKNGV